MLLQRIGQELGRYRFVSYNHDINIQAQSFVPRKKTHFPVVFSSFKISVALNGAGNKPVGW
jgi:hypothetical protein